jgi:acetyltransferase-like isoleucine patch superfamily enzyme
MKTALGHRLYEWTRRVRTRTFTLLIRGGFRRFGKTSVIRPPASIHGLDRIEIGDQVHIGPGSWLIALPNQNHRTDPAIRIGDGCSIAGDMVITAMSMVHLGRHVLMGRSVHISDHAHRHHDSDQPVMNQGLTSPQPVRIGDGTWLGQGVVVCPGVTIGRNCVVGANSIVRHSIPDHSLAVGAPAKVIRRIS